jgi:PIN domain nuclease of toxin-antitoxin system
MRLLLDTCTFLWLIGMPEYLPESVRQRVRDPGSQTAVSLVTLWECLIKHAKRRLGLRTGERSALDFLLWQCEDHRIGVLPIPIAALRPLERLPAIHGDPFDRLLICQAIEEGMAIVTPDVAIRRYPVKTIWDD